MSDEGNESIHEGQFLCRTQTRPAVEVDCSRWGGGVAVSEGQFCTPQQDTRRAVDMDGSSWMSDTPITLILSLQLDPAAEWMDATGDVIRRLDEAEQALEGGAGLVWDRVRSAPVGQGRVIVTLTPRNPEGAEARLAQLAEWAKVTIPQCVGARLAA
jgi:hypothetical protein